MPGCTRGMSSLGVTGTAPLLGRQELGTNTALMSTQLPLFHHVCIAAAAGAALGRCTPAPPAHLHPEPHTYVPRPSVLLHR